MVVWVLSLFKNDYKLRFVLEVLAVSQKQLDLVQLPEYEMEKAYEAVLQKIAQHYAYESDVRKNARQEQQKHIREAMVKGYEEMSQINLTICSECLHVEYEAEHVTGRMW